MSRTRSDTNNPHVSFLEFVQAYEEYCLIESMNSVYSVLYRTGVITRATLIQIFNSKLARVYELYSDGKLPFTCLSNIVQFGINHGVAFPHAASTAQGPVPQTEPSTGASE